MKIDVSELKRRMGNEETHTFEVPSEVLEPQEAPLSLREPGRMTVRLLNIGEGILARVEADLQLEIPCSRCLEPSRVPLALRYEEEFRAGGDGDAIIDLGEGFREQLFLALPMRTLCRPDCPGLCPRCGRRLDQGECNCEVEMVDPRLAILKEFKARQE